MIDDGKKISILGLEVYPATIPELNGIVEEAVSGKRKVILANHNLHSLYLFHHDPKLREFFFRADLAHIDGMGLVFLGRLFRHRLQREQRVTYVDWVRPLMREAARRGWRVFFVGGKPGVGETAQRLLREEFPGLTMSVHHGYFDMTRDSAENAGILAAIRDFRTDVLMVGMGMPRQEQWILDNLESLECRAILPAGACFDYIAKVIPTPPRWMGRMGLEWLYRLCSEPRRLWRRYLVEPLFICRLVLKHLCRAD